MPSLFPEPIHKLPPVTAGYEGIQVHVAQGSGHQIAFSEYERDAMLPEHTHGAQWTVVLEGRIDMEIGGARSAFVKGDRYFIPAGVPHKGRVYAGYADITFFDQGDRYKVKP